ncbi:MAG: hypothetical protein QOI25_4755, partial [Mycobacterium sp.]|nr:hypothetical protein [Mycobacterium sp.]
LNLVRNCRDLPVLLMRGETTRRQFSTASTSGLDMARAPLVARSRPTRRRCGTTNSNSKTLLHGATRPRATLRRRSGQSMTMSKRGWTKSARPRTQPLSPTRIRPQRLKQSSIANTARTLRLSMNWQRDWVENLACERLRPTSRASPETRVKHLANANPIRCRYIRRLMQRGRVRGTRRCRGVDRARFHYAAEVRTLGREPVLATRRCRRVDRVRILYAAEVRTLGREPVPATSPQLLRSLNLRVL